MLRHLLRLLAVLALLAPPARADTLPLPASLIGASSQAPR